MLSFLCSTVTQAVRGTEAGTSSASLPWRKQPVPNWTSQNSAFSTVPVSNTSTECQVGQYTLDYYEHGYFASTASEATWICSPWGTIETVACLPAYNPFNIIFNKEIKVPKIPFAIVFKFNDMSGDNKK